MIPHRVGRFVSLLLLFWTFGVSAQYAIEGKADLSELDPEAGPIYLNGEWEFYWNKLLHPSDFKSYQNMSFIWVPGSWHRQGDYPALGVSTYRLTVKLSNDQKGLSLYFPIVNSAAKIWINGELVHEAGKVTADREIYKPMLTGIFISVPENIHKAEIVMQVANFSYFSGGIAGTPLLGKTHDLFRQKNSAFGIENFFAGSLIALFIYQLILYLVYHRGKPYLWLALICLGVALRSLIVHNGSFLLPNLFPLVGWEVWKKIEFGSVYAIGALFPLYVYHLFNGYAPRWPVMLFVIISSALCVTVMVTPQYVYGKLLDVCHLQLLFAFVYAVYAISRAGRSGNKDARIILLGVLCAFPFILGEILKNSSFVPLNIHFMYMVEMGVLVFLLFQVYLLANHYAKSYKNLESLNQNLEKIVEERSGQLITANEVKDRLLSVMSHDIKSPLNSLRGILQIYNNGSISKDEFSQYARHIENDLNKTTILVENILYWTASQIRGVQIKIEEFALYNLIEENVQLFKTIASNKRLQLNHNTPKSLVIKSDRNVLNLVIRNLLSNAIKFSHQGGKIEILVKEETRRLYIHVQDEGIGMDEATLETLLAPELTVSSIGTENEKGTGLGLALCRDYLQKAGGELTVESERGSGSIFTITIPIEL